MCNLPKTLDAVYKSLQEIVDPDSGCKTFGILFFEKVNKNKCDPLNYYCEVSLRNRYCINTYKNNLLLL